MEDTPSLRLVGPGAVAAALDAVPDAVVTLDRSWRILHLNSRASDLLARTGARPDAALGRRLWEVLPDLRGGGFEEIAQRAERQGEPVEAEILSRRLRRWLSVRVCPLPDHLVVVVRDVDEEHREREALAEAAARYLLLTELATDLISVHAPTGAFQYASPICRSLLGYEPAELIGRPLAELIHPDDAAAVARAHAAVLRRPAARTVHLRVRRRDGGYVWLETVSRAVRDPASGTVQSILSISRDVTERRRLVEDERRARAAAEHAVERTARLQALTAALSEAATPQQVTDAVLHQGMLALGAVAGGVCLVTPEGGSQMLMSVFALGVDPEQLNRWSTFPLDAPYPVNDAVRRRELVEMESLDEFMARYPDIARHIAGAGYQAYLAAPLELEGRAIGCINYNFPVRRRFSDEDREFLLALARLASQAIQRAQLLEAEQRARAAAERSAEQMSRMYRLASTLAEAQTQAQVVEAVLAHTVEGLGAAAGVFARSVADGAELELVHAAGYPAGMVERWRRVPITAEMPLTHVVRTGEPVFLESAAERQARFPEFASSLPEPYGSAAVAPLIADGRLVGALALSFRESRALSREDRHFILTLAQQAAQALERTWLYESERQARQAAEKANQAKSQFLGVMSHELRTPLNAVLGYTDLLLMELRGTLTPGQREYVERIRSGAMVQLDMIEEILDYARIEAGRAEVRAAQADVRVIAHEAVELVLPQANRKGLELHLELPPEPLRVVTDAARARQILVNLVGNAVKFTPSGRVAVGVERQDGWVALWVRDTGPGIPPDMLESVFEPFTQLDQSETRESGGTGLGLAISRRLARLLAGEVVVRSEPGRGSEFTLRLPERWPGGSDAARV